MKDDLNVQFEAKNQEIFRNKLKLDIDNNLESLYIGVSNMLSTTFDNGKAKIIVIVESIAYTNSINDFIDKLESDICDEINKIVSYKKSYILDFIAETVIDDAIVGIYKKIINDLNDDILLKINAVCNHCEDDLKKFFESLGVNDFVYDRLLSYSKRFVSLLRDRIILQISNRDNNLINNLIESYDKYVDLNLNTTNI